MFFFEYFIQPDIYTVYIYISLWLKSSSQKAAKIAFSHFQNVIIFYLDMIFQKKKLFYIRHDYRIIVR